MSRHADCQHPATKAARAACRKGQPQAETTASQKPAERLQCQTALGLVQCSGEAIPGCTRCEACQDRCFDPRCEQSVPSRRQRFVSSLRGR